MFADDLTVLSRLKSGLDQLLSCLNDYATKWRIVFYIEKAVILVLGDRSRSATPAVVYLQETEVWKNLGKVWHSDINGKSSVQNSVQKGFEAISRMARLDCRSSALNPKNFAQLWKSIALPHMLYGCELWYLNKQHIRELEKVQNVFSKTVQSLLPGTSSSAARGLLGLSSIVLRLTRRNYTFWAELLIPTHTLRIENFLSEGR